MLDLIKTGLLAVTVVLLAVFVFSFPKSTTTIEPSLGAEVTNFTNSLVVDEFTQGGGVLSIATTGAAYTISAAEMDEYNVIELPTAAAAQAISLTLPATSSLNSVLPAPGDFREWLIDNQRAAATTTTIVAGAGIDLIAVTNADDVIDGQEKARLSCWRKANTDIACIVSELLAAD